MLIYVFRLRAVTAKTITTISTAMVYHAHGHLSGSKNNCHAPFGTRLPTNTYTCIKPFTVCPCPPTLTHLGGRGYSSSLDLGLGFSFTFVFVLFWPRPSFSLPLPIHNYLTTPLTTDFCLQTIQSILNSWFGTKDLDTQTLYVKLFSL